jgi:NADH dehydrogenase
MQVDDLAQAVLRLLQRPAVEIAVHAPGRICELGGSVAFSLVDYLRQLRPGTLAPARVVALPHSLTRALAHLCDLLHFSPFSYGHLELLGRDNVPVINALPGLLGRAASAIGAPSGDPRPTPGTTPDRCAIGTPRLS